MPTKQELASLSTTELVVMCGRVEENPPRFGDVNAKRGGELKKQWVSLQMPPLPFLKYQQKKEEELSKLHQEMAEFIAGIL